MPVLVFAQNKNTAKSNRVVMVVGKPMTNDDSVMVRNLFFSGLRDKNSENFKLATEEFAQVLQVDPQNDASMYELANIKKVTNEYTDARDLLELASRRMLDLKMDPKQANDHLRRFAKAGKVRLVVRGKRGQTGSMPIYELVTNSTSAAETNDD